ncbi:hypothetical protein E1A91_A05G393500v1 [Gossypium mustelinum]|uniref:Pyrrolo-quinoline quinone repeat domain-containing protein n=1 Tax=Gossypium mustelinum TaxID=34275 RepID=A0A5D2ZIY5_GOSMU|nr:hypothetical protein E1A91_A05G393500v1 [Gossypium mustelinum]
MAEQVSMADVTGGVGAQREVGPGGLGGGGTWGATTDKKRAYTKLANPLFKNFTLISSQTNITTSGWVAMDAKSVEILWSIVDPSNSRVCSPVTIANAVLFVGSTYKQGPIYAIDAKNGRILWSYETSATVYDGMSVSNGCIYVGNGYKVNVKAFVQTYSSDTSLFAFCVT